MQEPTTGRGTKHVILGTGPAGVIAAETIRKNAPDDEVLLIGDEADAPYSRMSIPQILSGHIGESGARLRRDADYFSRQRIELRRGRVVQLSERPRVLHMEDGSAIPFDKLLIATGARPRVPVIPGIDLPGVHACWTMDDARRLLALAKPRARAVLIGAGFIGCIVMEALATRGVHMTVIEKRDTMLPNMLGKTAGDMVRRWCERKGMQVLTDTRVKAIGLVEGWDPDSPKLVMLSDGRLLEADFVVYCAGATPNIDFLRGSGVRCLQGVVVDACMQTSLPGVYAAGDCAEAYDEGAGRSVIAGVQPNAADQAYCAALNMTGRQAFQRNVRHIDVVDTMGLISSSFGQWEGIRTGQWVEYHDPVHFKYLRLEFGGDVLIGCSAVGITEYSGILRSLIHHQVRLGEWKEGLMKNPLALKEVYRDCVQKQYIHQSSVFHTPSPSRASTDFHAM
ncbi:NAD(P)/FAD-dependent oxidoreductase [Noviherbaspirillum galbum]|uniref:NAD(P)/FAD-dependent oxidoreductase n=1 Tax=Noviherbaspirillum galbum TaxID=2709383 RepID=A0A6B3SS73_9BURK|nr:FAD-dependent oxidoreductase [Noviherbaspirillum galbum]NEX61656.1 NAD(P)/FAD-dependent oxidoreductase [Noviherbaspirillum galbum]